MPGLSLLAPGNAAIAHARATTGNIVGGATNSVVVTWPAPFTDANYTVAVTVENAANDLRVRCITARTATSITVAVENTDALNAATGTVHAVARHD